MIENFYIVATPIGNYNDITIRAIEILKNVDFIVCEEEREYRKLFSYLKIDIKKYIICNEHSGHREKEATELVIDLLRKGEIGALISDCGTPLFEDPGFALINAIRENGFLIVSIPGANSLITALSLSPFPIKDFYFAGFIPKKDNEREKFILDNLKRKEMIIFMETPYRLINLLDLLKKTLKNRKIYLPLDLTTKKEKLFYGNINEVYEKIKKSNTTKAEFLIIIERK